MSVTLEISSGGNLTQLPAPIIEVTVDGVTQAVPVTISPVTPMQVFASGGTTGAGSGDMKKSEYDPNMDGVIDDANKLQGKIPSELVIDGGYF